MFVPARIGLLALLLFLPDGEGDIHNRKKILAGIERTTNDMNQIIVYANTDSRGFKQALESNDKFVDFGQRFIANLTDFAGNITMINKQVIMFY